MALHITQHVDQHLPITDRMTCAIAVARCRAVSSLPAGTNVGDFQLLLVDRPPPTQSEGEIASTPPVTSSPSLLGMPLRLRQAKM